MGYRLNQLLDDMMGVLGMGNLLNQFPGLGLVPCE